MCAQDGERVPTANQQHWRRTYEEMEPEWPGRIFMHVTV